MVSDATAATSKVNIIKKYYILYTSMHTNPLLFIAPIDLLGERMQIGANSYDYLHFDAKLIIYFPIAASLSTNTFNYT